MPRTITYLNKSGLINDENIPDENKVTDEDMNEIKEVVNDNAFDLGELENTFQTITNSALNYKGSVATYNDLALIQNVNQGDIYTVSDEEKNYAYNGEAWFFYNAVETGYATESQVTIKRASIDLNTTIAILTQYSLGDLRYKVGNDSLEVYYCNTKLQKRSRLR